jgi:MOSC domain-containing protein YiiM
MLQSVVTDLCIGEARQPLRSVQSVRAVANRGLKGDRYGEGHGTYQKGQLGKRQVTLIDTQFLKETGWTLAQTRRNIAVQGNIDLMRLFSFKENVHFIIGNAVFRGVSYCDPCLVPTKLSEGAQTDNFRDVFKSRGGLVAEVIEGGTITVGDLMEVNLPAR